MQLRKNSTKAIHARRFSSSIRIILALATGSTGIANMLSVIVPKLNWDMLLGAWPVDTHNGMHKLIVVVGFFLLMLSYGLIRGKYEAWCISLVLLLLSSCLYILSGSQVLATIMIEALAVLLILFSRFFRAKSDPPSVRRGYVALFVGLGTVTLYAIGGLFVLFNQFEPLVDRVGIEEVVLRLLTNAHVHLTYGTQAFFFGRALPVLCLSAVLYGIVMILRPVAARLFPNEQQRQAASSLIRLYGRSSISYFALDTDKLYFFSASGKSVISYVLKGNVAVVAGDPIGAEEEMPSVIEQFMAFCNEQDWRIVFWQVRDTLVDLYRAAGLHLLKMGEDAVITTHTFTLTGKTMANVRVSEKRAEREGIRIIFSHGPVQDAELLAQMEQISHTWLVNKGSSEMGFSMGHFDIHGDCEQIYALALDTTNKVYAFVTFVPIYGRNGWGLDLMRRTEHTPPGTMELLLARSVEYLKSGGADIVSLGLAPMSNVIDDHESFLETSIDFLTHLFGNQSRNRSLFNFKKKFQPRWESRYLVYSNTLTLPKVGWALYHAHLRDASLLTEFYRLLKKLQVKHQAMHTGTVNLASPQRHSGSGGLSL